MATKPREFVPVLASDAAVWVEVLPEPDALPEPDPLPLPLPFPAPPDRKDDVDVLVGLRELDLVLVEPVFGELWPVDGLAVPLDVAGDVGEVLVGAELELGVADTTRLTI